MRSLILASIGTLVLIGTASLALRIDASIAEEARSAVYVHGIKAVVTDPL